MTGKPCFHPKTLHVTEAKDYQATAEHHMCNGCAPTYMQLSQIGQEPMLFSPQPIPTPLTEPAPEEPKPKKNKKEKHPPKKVPVKYIETAEQLFDMFMMKPPSKKNKEKEIACPKCGLTPAEFQSSGKLGCADCFDYYKNDLPDVLKGCQEGAVKHIGKKPKTPTDEPVESVQTLKLRMAHAVEMEKYEEAAVLKKKIAELEKEKS